MRFYLLALCSLVLLHCPLFAEEGPLPPLEAARTMQVPPGFKVTLFAGEPDVRQPIAMTFDDRGRLWVVECFSYPEKTADSDDRVVIFEDKDNDGRFDKKTVFWDKGTNVTGIEYGFGGIWLTATPNLLFIPDKDGDDKPDGEPQVILDGWDLKAKHNKVNALIWGPDGWLYGCNGILSNSLLGPPGTPEAERTPMNCGVWRWHPTKHRFEVVATGTTNPWGIDFDQYGQLFITNCVIQHLWHVTPGSHFQRMYGQDFNPHYYRLMESCADHIHWAGGPWQESRGNQPQHSDFGGGHAHVGCMIYKGDNWPKEYRGKLFTCNIHGLRINMDEFEPQGSSVVAHHGKDFLFAKDPYFRGVMLKEGPDGGVYVLDWSDTGECHNYKEVDRKNGRIFKITYGEVKPPEFKDLTKMNPDPNANDMLLFLLGQRRGWYGEHARRILAERTISDLMLEKLFGNLARLGGGNLQGLWMRHVAQKWPDGMRNRLLKNSDPHIRGWYVALELDATTASDRSQMIALAKSDPSPIVRRQLASSLQRITSGQQKKPDKGPGLAALESRDLWDLAAALIEHSEDEAEVNLTLLYWYAIEPLVPTDQERAVKLLKTAKIPLLREYIARRIGSLAVGDQTVATITPLVELLAGSDDPQFQRDILQGMQDSFSGRREVTMPGNWPATYRKLLASSNAEVRERSTVLSLTFGDPQAIASLRATLGNTKALLAERETALQALLQKKDVELVPLLNKVLSVPGLRGPAVRALAAYNERATPQVILSHYAGFNEDEKREAIGTLSSRPSYALVMLQAVEADTIPRGDLTAFVARQLAGYRDQAIDEKLAKVWGEVRATSQDKKQRINQLKQELKPNVLKKADLTHGRAVFAKTCASCHKLFDAGIKIGPELTGSQRTNLDYVLENLVDPNAVIGRDYQMTNIQTTDGRVINGIIREENDNAVTVQTPTDRIVVPKDEIEARVRSPLSMMPEELLTKLSPADLRDLVAYLASPTQVPLPESHLAPSR